MKFESFLPWKKPNRRKLEEVTPMPEAAAVRPLSFRDTVIAIAPWISKHTFDGLEELPEKVRNDILEYIREKNKAGMPSEELSKKVDDIVHKSWELESMTAEQNSDKQYHPRPSHEEIKFTKYIKKVNTDASKDADMWMAMAESTIDEEVLDRRARLEQFKKDRRQDIN